MPKCKKCGKKGFFLNLNPAGVCLDCELEERRIAAENERLRLRQEKIDQEIQLRMDKIESVPRCEISRDGKKSKIVGTSVVDEITYSTVTARSSIKRFLDFVVLDLETTGLSVSRNYILEISAIKFKSLEPVELFHTFIKPHKKDFVNEAISVNHIQNSDVENCPYIYEVMPSLQSFVSNLPLLGHNLAFDLKFLIRNGFDINVEKRKFFDTMKIAQRILKKPKYVYDDDYGEYTIDFDKDYDVYDYKLDTLCEYYNIPRTAMHTGLGDCIDTVLLFKALLSEKIDDSRLSLTL